MNVKNKLPKSYEEVFIWYNGARRIARLNHDGTNFQLATFLADTKGQYLCKVSDVDKWCYIKESHNDAS